MAEIWYKVELYSRPEISEVEVLRHTDRSVWIHSELWEKTQRHPRRADGTVYHCTLNTAIDEVRRTLQQRKNDAEEQLSYAINRVLDFESLVETGKVLRGKK